MAEVDALLGRVVADDAQDREAAVRELLEAKAKHVSAIRFRLGAIADAADKEAMKRLLLKTRRELLGQEGRRRVREAFGRPRLPGAPGRARPSRSRRPGATWSRVLALSRMLESIGSVESVRGLVDVYARFGEFLRITTQNALGRLGDKAVPALIEAERHPAEKIAKWAVRQLDMLGKGIPSEAVQTPDPGRAGRRAARLRSHPHARTPCASSSRSPTASARRCAKPRVNRSP